MIRLFRAMAKMTASFRGILNIKSLNYELMSENSDYCVSGRDCPSVIQSRPPCPGRRADGDAPLSRPSFAVPSRPPPGPPGSGLLEH